MKLFGKEINKQTKHKTYYIFGIKISKKNKYEFLKAENEYLRNAINQIGADKMPIATGKLREWQLELIDLMKEFDKVCRANGVRYWLDFGTLLGAVRHKGFIPWDDDVDTSMLISDLNKILPILKEHFCNTNFIVRERAGNCNNFQIRIHHIHYNLGLDIFPVYEYPEKTLTENLEKDITEKIIYARKIFEKKYPHRKLSQNQIIDARRDIIELQNQIIIKQKKQNIDNPILFHGIDFPYEEGYYVMPYDMIFPLKKGIYEGIEFYIPNRSEEYLSKLWNNWINIPSGLGVYEHFKENYKDN